MAEAEAVSREPLVVKLEDLDLFDIGNSIQLYGAIYSGKGYLFLVPLPDEDLADLSLPTRVLAMTAEEMETFLQQTDVLDIRGPEKAILRKSQRQVDQKIAWDVFRRDRYACRYCGNFNIPLTVDHVILWEAGGATVAANLVAACKRCNKLRGNTEYSEWLRSDTYQKLSQGLSSGGREANLTLLTKLDYLKRFEMKPRSR